MNCGQSFWAQQQSLVGNTFFGSFSGKMTMSYISDIQIAANTLFVLMTTHYDEDVRKAALKSLIKLGLYFIFLVKYFN